jgi:hypothetical protein
MRNVVPVSFSWFVPKAGYKILDAHWLVEADASRAALPNARRRVYPLEDSPDLFLQFAEFHKGVDSFDEIARFASTHGWLGVGKSIDGDSELWGERLPVWFNHAEAMDIVMRLQNALVARDLTQIKQVLSEVPEHTNWEQVPTRNGDLVRVADFSGRQPDYDIGNDLEEASVIAFNQITAIVNWGLLQARPTLQAVMSNREGKRELKLLPQTLLGVMWLQLAQLIETESEVRSCVECGSQFAVRPGAGARKSRKFCRSGCKSADYRLRREARELERKDVDLDDIIKKLQRRAPIKLTEERVRGWLGWE